MNYNRYLDLHLCSTTFSDDDERSPDTDFFTHRGTKYRYDFLEDMQRQADYRETKAEGYESGAWAKLNSRENAIVLDSSELTHSQKPFLQPSALGGISEELSRLRYVACLVSIERLREVLVYPQLQSLVQWISDNRTINKLRINCHGGGTSTSGFKMGGELSPAEFIDSLVHHGLTSAPKASQNLAGLAHAARWKRDNEVSLCEKCKNGFSFTQRRHHCRRCGGIFCDRCSSWKVDLKVALAGESNKTVTNVKNARVCQQCFLDAMAANYGNEVKRDAVRGLQGNETMYGLKQITLGLCLGAKSDDAFSAEPGRGITQEAVAPGAHDGFIAGSLAARLLSELRGHQLVGIKVTATNQAVSGGTGEMINKLGVKWPEDNRAVNSYKGFADRSIVDFRAVIWGESAALKGKWDARKATNSINLPASSDIVMHADGRSLAFGASNNNQDAYTWLQTAFLSKWKFVGWVIGPGTVYSAPSRQAQTYTTIMITPPPRVTRVAVKNKRVYLIGRKGEESFKDYKSYGVS